MPARLQAEAIQLLDTLPRVAERLRAVLQAQQQQASGAEARNSTAAADRRHAHGPLPASLGEGFQPGCWEGWPGLQAAGVRGTAAELLLDEVLDAQEALPKGLSALDPWCGAAVGAHGPGHLGS